MKTSSYATIAIFCYCIFFCTNIFAQNNKPGYEIGFRLSGLVYQGDLAPSAIGSYKTPTSGFGIFGTRIFNRFFSIRGNLDYNKLRGNDAAYSTPQWKQERNFSFSATALELSVHLVYDLKNNYSNTKFAPYVFGGAGISFLNIKRDYSAFNPDYPGWQSWVFTGLAEDIQKTPPRSAVIIPVGAGFKYPITQNLGIFGEASYRFMFTDYLDGFSKSADQKWKDHYSNISVGLVYRFINNAIHCPGY